MSEKKSNIFKQTQNRDFLGLTLRTTLLVKTIISLIFVFFLSGCIGTNKYPTYRNLAASSEDTGICLRKTSPKIEFYKHIFPKPYCETSDDCPKNYMCDRSYNVCEIALGTSNFSENQILYNLYIKDFFFEIKCLSKEDCSFFEECVKKPVYPREFPLCTKSNCPDNFSCNRELRVCIKN